VEVAEIKRVMQIRVSMVWPARKQNGVGFYCKRDVEWEDDPLDSLAIVFPRVGEVALETDRVAEPGLGEILIRTRKTLVSTGTESIALSGRFDEGSHWGEFAKFPMRPGYSLSGEIVAVGDGVIGLSEGDHVAARAPHQQYVVAAASDVRRIPKGVSDEDATWFGLANIAQNGVRQVDHALGEAVAVVGLGLLGQLIVQYTRLLGAREVIAIDPASRRLEMAMDHGATVALATDAGSARTRVLELTGGSGVDVAYDATGAAPVLPDALSLLKRFGRLVLIGDTGFPNLQHLTGDVVIKGLRIFGAHDGNPPPISSDHAFWSHERMTELFFKYLQRGDMRVSDMITHRYSPQDADEAYQMLANRRSDAMGVVFDWTQL